MSACVNEMALLERMVADNNIKEAWLESVQYPIPQEDFFVIVSCMEWPKRVRTIIQVHTKRIQEEYDHYEAALKKHRSEFLELLERYDFMGFHSSHPLRNILNRENPRIKFVKNGRD